MIYSLGIAAAIVVIYFVIEYWVVNYSEEFPHDDKHWR